MRGTHLCGRFDAARSEGGAPPITWVPAPVPVPVPVVHNVPHFPCKTPGDTPFPLQKPSSADLIINLPSISPAAPASLYTATDLICVAGAHFGPRGAALPDRRLRHVCKRAERAEAFRGRGRGKDLARNNHRCRLHGPASGRSTRRRRLLIP